MVAAVGYCSPDIRILKGVALCTSYYFPLSLKLREDVGLIENFMKCGIWVDVGAVCVSFINDLSC